MNLPFNFKVGNDVRRVAREVLEGFGNDVAFGMGGGTLRSKDGHVPVVLVRLVAPIIDFRLRLQQLLRHL